MYLLSFSKNDGVVKRTVLRVRSNLEIKYERSESRSPTSKNFNVTSSKDTEQCA